MENVCRTEHDRPEHARERQRSKARHQHHIDPRRLVFIDETWVKTETWRRSGWGPRADACWLSFLAGTQKHLPFHNSSTRRWHLDPPSDHQWTHQQRALHTFHEKDARADAGQGDLVVLDGWRRPQRSRRSTRCSTMPAPPHDFLDALCRPDLNPMEQLFAELGMSRPKAEPGTSGDMATDRRYPGPILAD